MDSERNSRRAYFMSVIDDVFSPFCVGRACDKQTRERVSAVTLDWSDCEIMGGCGYNTADSRRDSRDTTERSRS